jgi:hypothetical protein
VRQARGEPGLVDEHVDEVGVDGELRKDALECDALFEAVGAHALGDEYFRHASGREPALDQVRLVAGVIQPLPLARRRERIRHKDRESAPQNSSTP